MDEELPSNEMTNDIAHLALVSQFAASCVFMDHDDVMRLTPLMVHFGFTEKQRTAITDLMLASMED